MNKYRVIIGTHTEDGRTYKKGEVVHSYNELDKLFPNKFEALGPVPVKSPVLVTTPPAKGSSAKTDPKAKGLPKADDWDGDKEE